MGLGECVRMHVHHRSVTALKVLVLRPLIPPCPLPLATTNHFTVSIILPFPEYHGVGTIIQHIVFSYRLLSLRNVHVRFFHVFSWLHSSFLFIVE